MEFPFTELSGELGTNRDRKASWLVWMDRSAILKVLRSFQLLFFSKGEYKSLQRFIKIIHEDKTKEITTVKEVWIRDLISIKFGQLSR